MDNQTTTPKDTLLSIAGGLLGVFLVFYVASKAIALGQAKKTTTTA